MPQAVKYDFDDESTCVKTAFGEARGGSAPAEADVLWVIRNRFILKQPLWGLGSLYAVARAPGQFSCWSLQAWNEANLNAMIDLRTNTDDYNRIADLLAEIASGKIADPTNGATYYYAKATAQPAWTREQRDPHTGLITIPAPTPCRIDALHEFYSIWPDSRMIDAGSIP